MKETLWPLPTFILHPEAFSHFMWWSNLWLWYSPFLWFGLFSLCSQFFTVSRKVKEWNCMSCETEKELVRKMEGQIEVESRVWVVGIGWEWWRWWWGILPWQPILYSCDSSLALIDDIITIWIWDIYIRQLQLFKVSYFLLSTWPHKARGLYKNIAYV